MMHATAAAKTFDGLGLLCFQMVVSLLVTSWTSQAGFFNPVEIFSNSVSAYYCLLALLMMARQKHGSTLAAHLSVRSVKAVKVYCIYSVFSVVCILCVYCFHPFHLGELHEHHGKCSKCQVALLVSLA